MYSVDLRTAERGIDPVAAYETVLTGVCPLSTSIVDGGTTVLANLGVVWGAIVGLGEMVRGGIRVDKGGTVVCLAKVRGGSLSSSEALGDFEVVTVTIEDRSLVNVRVAWKAADLEKGDDGPTTLVSSNLGDSCGSLVTSKYPLSTNCSEREQRAVPAKSLEAVNRAVPRRGLDPLNS
jgi:hypothetical protein